MLSWAGPEPSKTQRKDNSLWSDYLNASEEKLGGIRQSRLMRKIVFIESNTERNTFIYNDTGLQPWMQCEYKVRLELSWPHLQLLEWGEDQAGTSGWPLSTQVAQVSVNPPKVLIAWVSPEQPNGIIQSYRLQRNGVLYLSKLDAVTFNYTDEKLLLSPRTAMGSQPVPVGATLPARPPASQPLRLPLQGSTLQLWGPSAPLR